MFGEKTREFLIGYGMLCTWIPFVYQFGADMSVLNYVLLGLFWLPAVATMFAIEENREYIRDLKSSVEALRHHNEQLISKIEGEWPSDDYD